MVSGNHSFNFNNMSVFLRIYFQFTNVTKYQTLIGWSVSTNQCIRKCGMKIVHTAYKKTEMFIVKSIKYV